MGGVLPASVFISNVDRGPSSRLTDTPFSWLHSPAQSFSVSPVRTLEKGLLDTLPDRKGFLGFQLHFKILTETHQLSTYFYVLFL